MEATSKKMKVICPCETKDGKKYWRLLGSAFLNRDNSINVYLDSLPVNGKLQVRDWDEPRSGDSARVSDAAPQYGPRTLNGHEPASREPLPFLGVEP